MGTRIILMIALMLCVKSTNAQEKYFSVGADVIGSALSLEYEVTTKSSARLDVDFLLGDANTVVLNPEFHFHKTNNTMDLGNSNTVTPYHGPGAVIGLSEGENSFGLEFVWGLEYDTDEIPFEVFIDAGPYILIEPSTFFTITSSFGARYKF